jgi:hypothetical protein
LGNTVKPLFKKIGNIDGLPNFSYKEPAHSPAKSTTADELEQMKNKKSENYATFSLTLTAS